MSASYALELHALKAELQSTLARLGIDTVSSDDETDARHHVDALSVLEIAAESTETRPRRRNSGRNRPITRWNRRRLVHELAAASSRRRQLETQLHREMESDRQQQQVSDEQSRRQSAWQAAILELQQQRAEIQRQMEAETAEEMHQTAEREREEQVSGAEDQSERVTDRRLTVESVSETHYSIGGVVTLEPLASFQQVPGLASSRSGVSMRPTVVTAAAVSPTEASVSAPAMVSVLDAYPRYRNTPDALSDVFSLQLKFAETMLKLEKSVQMRDRLLHHGGALSKHRTAAYNTRQESHARRRHGHQSVQRRASFEGSSNSDSSVMYRETHRSESYSSSVYSPSSLDSTPRRGETIRVRYPNFGVSRATTAETLAPSSSCAIHSPSLDTTGGGAPASSTTTLSPQESPSAQDAAAQGSDAQGELSEARDEEIHRTPTTGSSVTTPTTGSDQKSNASSKQVRFGDDAYSTPVLARKFNFDNPSIDEDDFEEKTEDEESIPSFLGGSTVTSVELNDASFLRAFQRFRRELKVSEHDSCLQSPVLARKLFPASNMDFPSLNSDDEGAKINLSISDGATGDNFAQSASAPVEEHDQTARFPGLSGLSVEELQERRRQLCLDIQAASAQLVLNFGAMQSVATGSQGADLTKDCLLALRDELKAVDSQIRELQ
ncbi:uncharacterized protein KRP23_10361 [Phytophthora ramorum]|uniref:uncharacterized protein n=1 Tax=Phytophthora ramorum TaxID=164328 RepID=UPI00309DFADF|nr:hypothetical protein KRP23_10361 [Phytophthora ramorum]